MNMNINNNTKAASEVRNMNTTNNAERFSRRPIFALCTSAALVLAAGTAVIHGFSRSGNVVDTVTVPLAAAAAESVAETTAASATTTTTITAATIETEITELPATTTTIHTVYICADTDMKAPETTAAHAVTNGYDIADYPVYSEYIRMHYNDPYYADYSFALYDVNTDGTPELLVFYNAEKQNIHEIRDIELNSYVRSNMTACSYLCEGGTVLAVQGDSPYAQCAFIKLLNKGINERIECLTICGEISAVNGGFAFNEYETYKGELYRYVPTGSERYGRDSFVQCELGIQTPSDDMRISLDEVYAVLSKYQPVSVETDMISSLF